MSTSPLKPPAQNLHLNHRSRRKIRFCFPVRRALPAAAPSLAGSLSHAIQRVLVEIRAPASSGLIGAVDVIVVAIIVAAAESAEIVAEAVRVTASNDAALAAVIAIMAIPVLPAGLS